MKRARTDVAPGVPRIAFTIAGMSRLRPIRDGTSFTEEPENVAGYGALCDEQGHELFRVRAIGPCKGGVIVAAEGSDGST